MLFALFSFDFDFFGTVAFILFCAFHLPTTHPATSLPLPCHFLCRPSVVLCWKSIDASSHSIFHFHLLLLKLHKYCKWEHHKNVENKWIKFQLCHAHLQWWFDCVAAKTRNKRENFIYSNWVFFDFEFYQQIVRAIFKLFNVQYTIKFFIAFIHFCSVSFSHSCGIRVSFCFSYLDNLTNSHDIDGFIFITAIWFSFAPKPSLNVRIDVCIISLCSISHFCFAQLFIGV